MAGKEHVVSMEGFFRREGGETSSGVTENAQTYSISIESTTLEARIDAVMEANLTPSPPPKIQKVKFLLRDHKDFQKLYEPRAVSLGPIHYGSEKYKLGEKYKLKLTREFVKGNKGMINDLYKKIGEKIEELKECFEKEVIERHKDEDLIWLLLVDGCAILQYIDCAANDEFAVLKIKTDAAFTRQDLFSLENQLPYRLLSWLMTWTSNEGKLKESIDNYINKLVTVPPPYDESVIFSWKWLSSLSLHCSHYAENRKEESLQSKAKRQEDPIHLLDLLRTRLLDNHQRRNNPQKSNEKVQSNWQSYRNVQELRAAGIYVERTKKKNSCLRDIDFTTLGCLGYLWLPPITVDDSTRPMFLNLIAYEMCLDFQNDFAITSYIYFLNSLISEANDVKMLRKAGILYNCLGSDEVVAKVFNEIGTDLMPNIETYSDVKSQIQKFHDTLSSWMFRFYHDHFAGTWSIAGFLGAVLALSLSGIQAWFTVNPPSERHG